MLASHRAAAAVLWFIEQRQMREHITSPTAPPPSHSGTAAASFGKLSEAKLCGGFSADTPSQRFHRQSKKKKTKKTTHSPVVWTERCVRGITLGSFPAHEIPQELFNCLQCLSLAGKGMHVAAWRTQSGDQD